MMKPSKTVIAGAAVAGLLTGPSPCVPTLQARPAMQASPSRLLIVA
jgi:hypothetical protein